MFVGWTFLSAGSGNLWFPGHIRAQFCSRERRPQRGRDRQVGDLPLEFGYY